MRKLLIVLLALGSINVFAASVIDELEPIISDSCEIFVYKQENSHNIPQELFQVLRSKGYSPVDHKKGPFSLRYSSGRGLEEVWPEWVVIWNVFKLDVVPVQGVAGDITIKSNGGFLSALVDLPTSWMKNNAEKKALKRISKLLPNCIVQ